MKVKKVYYIVAGIIVLSLPIALNYLLQCPSPFTNIIGGQEASTVWLNFWATYVGSIISVLIPLYILSETLNFNKNQNIISRSIEFKKFIYQNRINRLDKIIDDGIELIDCYNSNSFKEINNLWIQTNNHEECRLRLKYLMDKSFIAYEKFTLHFSQQELYSDFLRQQYENYKQLVYLMHDIQLLVMCDYHIIHSDINAIKEQILKLGFPPSAKFESILNNLKIEEPAFNQILKAYSCISQVEVEKQIRLFINEQRKAIENILF